MKFYVWILALTLTAFSASAGADEFTDQIEPHLDKVGKFISNIDVDQVAQHVKEGQRQFAGKADKIAKLVAERTKAHSADFKKWSEKAQPVFEEAGRHIASVSKQLPSTIKRIESEINSGGSASDVTD